MPQPIAPGKPVAQMPQGYGIAVNFRRVCCNCLATDPTRPYSGNAPDGRIASKFGFRPVRYVGPNKGKNEC
jgi:hypothetical protein